MVSLISEMLRLMQCALYVLCRTMVPLCHIIYAISHRSSLYTLHSVPFWFFFLGSALWTQLQLGGLFTFRGGALCDRCKHGPAQSSSYMTWCYDDTIFIHVCLCSCVCVDCILDWDLCGFMSAQPSMLCVW